MNVDITDDGVIYYTPEEIEKRLGYARRCTAHLEPVSYTHLDVYKRQGGHRLE